MFCGTNDSFLRNIFNTYTYNGVRKSVLLAFVATVFIASFGKQVLARYLLAKESHGTRKNRYAVAVKKDGTVIGHLLRKVYRVCSLFLSS